METTIIMCPYMESSYSEILAVPAGRACMLL